MAIVGVLPAAGFATRLQPLATSKEVLPLGGRPVIDYAVERMRAASCDEIRVVTRPEKRDVVTHCRGIGAHVILARPATVTESLRAGLEGLAADDIVLLGWPDAIWEPVDGYVRLLEALGPGSDVALGLFRPEWDLERSDVVVRADDGSIQAIDVKPAAPRSAWIWGIAAARAARLEGLEAEEWPGQFFDALCRRGVPVRGIELSDVWLDVGTKEALARVETWLRARRT